MNPIKLIVILTAAFFAMNEAANSAVKTPIDNGILKSDAIGYSGSTYYGWTRLSKVGVGTGTGNATVSGALIQLFPTGTDGTEGIKWGSDVTLYRSAASTLYLAGNLSVSGSVTAGITGNFGTLSGNNAWTGTNTFSNTSTFNGTTVIGTSGLSFTGSGAANSRTALGLVIGSDVQQRSYYLESIHALGTPGANNVMMGNGTVWTQVAPATARTNLGLAIGTNVQAQDLRLQAIATIGAPTSNYMLVGNGTTWIHSSPTAVKTALSLTPGSNVQAWDANLDQIAALTPAANTFIMGNGSAQWTLVNAAATKTALTLGTADIPQFTGIKLLAGSGGTTLVDTATSDISINLPNTAGTLALTDQADGKINLATAVAGIMPVASGGTGKASIGTGKFLYTASANTYSEGTVGTTGLLVLAGSTASDIQTTLGLVPGTNVQVYDADLATIAGFTPGTGKILLSSGGVWTASTPTAGQVLVGVGTAWTAQSGSALLTAMGAQPLDTDLTTLAGLTATSGRIIMSVGSAWSAYAPGTSGDVLVSEDGATWTKKNGAALLTTIGAQPLDTELTLLAGLTETNGNIIMCAGGAWASSTPTDVKTVLGLGTANTPVFTGTVIKSGAGGTTLVDASGSTAINVTLPAFAGTVLVAPTAAGDSTFGASVRFEGATADSYETTLTVTDPTADNTITLPNASGTLTIIDSETVDTTGNITKAVTLANTNGGSITRSLPAAAASTNRIYTVKKIDAGNSITIDTPGSELIDGATAIALSDANASVTLFCNGTNWYITASYVPPP